MKKQPIMPDAACKYILFQRTECIAFAKNRLYRFAKRHLPSVPYMGLVRLEAFVRRSRIKVQYLQRMEDEYQSVEQHIPKPCGSVLDIGCGIGGIARLALPARRPASIVELFKPKKKDVFCRMRSDGSEAEEMLFQRDDAGNVSSFVQHSNIAPRIA